MTLQNENFISWGILRNSFMSSTLCINIRNKRHLSIIVSSDMVCNWTTTSCRVVLASCNLRMNPSVMWFSCSLLYWIALRTTTTINLVFLDACKFWFPDGHGKEPFFLIQCLSWRSCTSRKVSLFCWRNTKNVKKCGFLIFLMDKVPLVSLMVHKRP